MKKVMKLLAFIFEQPSYYINIKANAQQLLGMEDLFGTSANWTVGT